MWNQAVGYALKVNAQMVVIVRTHQNHMSAIAVQALRVMAVLQTSMNVSRTGVKTMPPVSMVSPIIPVTASKAGRVGCKCIYFLSSIILSGNWKNSVDKLTVVVFGKVL